MKSITRICNSYISMSEENPYKTDLSINAERVTSEWRVIVHIPQYWMRARILDLLSRFLAGRRGPGGMCSPRSPCLCSARAYWGCAYRRIGWSNIPAACCRTQPTTHWHIQHEPWYRLQHSYFNSYSASRSNWCTATLWNRIMTAQCEGMGEVGSARYEPALLPPCPSIRVLSYSNSQEIHSRQQTGLAVKC